MWPLTDLYVLLYIYLISIIFVDKLFKHFFVLYLWLFWDFFEYLLHTFGMQDLEQLFGDFSDFLVYSELGSLSLEFPAKVSVVILTWSIYWWKTKTLSLKFQTTLHSTVVHQHARFFRLLIANFSECPAFHILLLRPVAMSYSPFNLARLCFPISKSWNYIQ